MSDLFKPDVQYGDSATDFFSALCNNTNLGKESSIIKTYPKGWQNILRIFISKVQHEQHEILINVKFGEIEVYVDADLSELNKHQLFFAIYELQKCAKNTCMKCGDRGKKIIEEKSVFVSCKNCYGSQSKNESQITGTWLDNF